MKPNEPTDPNEGTSFQEAEARFRAAFEGAPAGIALLDLSGRFLQVNAALCRILGRAETELLGVTWRDVTNALDHDVQEAYELEALAGGRDSFQWETRYVRPDGSDVWALISRSLVRDDRDRPLYFISQVLDITGRKRAEQALLDREEATRQILETAQDAFIGMDASGDITDWNRQAEIIFGWNREDAIGRPLAETIIPNRLRQAHWSGLRRFLETGEGPVLNQRLELTGLRRDGTEFPVEITIWPMPMGGSMRFNALVHDISERAESQKELSRQREELAALHETTVDLIRRLEPTSLLGAILSRAAGLIDAEHGYLYVVDHRAGDMVVRAGIGMFSEYLGFRLASGKGVAGRVWESGKPLAIADYQDWEGRVEGFESIRALVALPLRAANEIVGVIGLIHVEEQKSFSPEEVGLLDRFARLASVALDNARLYAAAQDELRERRRAEEELERAAVELQRANEDLRAADALKDHFVAVTSHELRTPLTSVLGFAKTLLSHWERIPEVEKRDQIRLIEDQANRLSRLVDELLTLSKIEAGALEARPRPVPAGEAVAAVLTAFGDAAKGIEVDIDREQRVLADPDHLHQILTNYVANALKYGRPPITIEATDVDEHVEIRVSDNGEGVPPAFVPRLFERFAQAGTAQGGTGLGLSIVKGLARAQGGEVWYEPGEPQGACFGLRLPTP
jgi:PAS domain S-box-containing protein